MYIAVCDDQTEELKDLTELLGAWETDRGTPVRVKSFRSAAELLDAARHERFTLYLLDIMMPGLNGMDAAREIRGFDKAADIIFLTSSPASPMTATASRRWNICSSPFEPRRSIPSLTGWSCVSAARRRRLRFAPAASSCACRFRSSPMWRSTASTFTSTLPTGRCARSSAR